MLLDMVSPVNANTHPGNIPAQTFSFGPRAQQAWNSCFTIPTPFTLPDTDPVYVKTAKDDSQCIHYEVDRMIPEKPYPITWYNKDLYLIKGDDVVHLVDKTDLTHMSELSSLD